ncbi:MAG TPA: glycosyltransferase [Candidatus Solibacter sp.]|nr:glycosyltransferase [Candidatus Solibacter sp.]
MRRPKIVLLYVDSGGGHRAAANALTEVVRQQQRPWDLELVSIQDLLDPIDFIRKSTGIRFQDVYNIMLRRGWTAGSEHSIRLAHWLIRMTHASQVQILEEYWKSNRPDLVVSLIPHYNRSVREALDRAWPGTKYVTLLTDIADYPPHFWIERIDQWVICGSEEAVAQARHIGMPGDRILRTSGMILSPRFYEPLSIDRAAELARRGLRSDLQTGLVLFGGEGSQEMLKIAQALNGAAIGVQLILICGKNEALANELRAMERRIPMFVEGFTREIPTYMELSDFLIGKPGPGSLSEALAKKLPVIVQKNAWTMAHERYNAAWIEHLGAGIVIGNFSRDIVRAVERMLLPSNYASYRRCAAATRNNAVYEIPEMLSRILGEINGEWSRPDPVCDYSGQSR